MFLSFLLSLMWVLTKFVTVDPYPNDGHVRAPIGVDGAQMGHGPRLDQLAKSRW